MTTLVLLVVLMCVGFFGLCWWLGKQATKNPTEAAQLGVRLGKWLMK